MQDTLLQRLKNVMAEYGLTIPEMSFLGPKLPLREILKASHDLFLVKTNAEILKETISKKLSLQKDLLLLDFCPFEKVTSVPWLDMFNAAYYSFMTGETRNPVKNIVPFFHFLLPSSVFRDENFHPHTVCGTRFEMEFSYTGKEMVRIHGTRYVYGEAGVVIDKINNEKFLLRTHVPAVVFDDKILPLLRHQPRFDEVIENLYLLYHMASHDSWIHSVFLETLPAIREIIKTDPVMEKFTHQYYFCYDMYEMNFMRLNRQMLNAACEKNSNLHTEVHDSYWNIRLMTADWHPVARDYIRFIARERLGRLLPNTIYEPPRTYISDLPLAGKKTTRPSYGNPSKYLQYITHGRSDRDTALVHNDDSTIEEISYEAMARSMLECLKKVNPFL